MIEMKEGCWYLGIWYVNGPDRNWMACVWQDEEQFWHLRYRFRYDAGTDDPFDGVDEKNWWSVKSQRPHPIKSAKAREMEAATHQVAELTAKKYGSKVEFVEIRGDYEKAMFLLAQQPWSNIKTERVK